MEWNKHNLELIRAPVDIRDKIVNAKSVEAFQETMPIERMRNFSIIAHIDHGKSTLADRLLEATGNLTKNQEGQPQVLDSLDVERQRGITVKAQSASLFYKHPHDNETYLLNLIDTPGHVDFAYEVSRSLAACQGALLLVDATQGVQAQTVANYNLALEQNLDVVPVITKMDMPTANVPEIEEQIFSAFDMDPETALQVSGKTGFGVLNLLSELVMRLKSPACLDSSDATMRALVIDSWYDIHRGVICLVEVFDGSLSKGDRVGSYHGGGGYDVQEVGVLTPTPVPTNMLTRGQVGYVIANIKTTRDIRLGDSFFKLSPRKSASADLAIRETIKPLPGFKQSKSMVFAGVFPHVSSDYDGLRNAVEKLTLNDSSVTITKDSSQTLGQGFRCGFLGILHMDVFCQRLDDEFGASVVLTSPTVSYKCWNSNEEEPIIVDSPANFPDTTKGTGKWLFEEPVVLAKIICPEDVLGSIIELCNDHRGVQEDMNYISASRVMVKYTVPLSEIVEDFYDKLKKVSSGYASLDYEEAGWKSTNLVKMDIRINGEAIDAFSVVCAKEKTEDVARRTVQRLKSHIDRQNFEIVIQAAISNKIIARERIAPYRKDVLIKSGKLVGGGDVTRKMKLLAKQKEGKKRMKASSKVKISQDTIVSVLKSTSSRNSKT